MTFTEIRTSLFLLGILFTSALSSGLDWELQGENQWNYNPVISYNAGPINNNQGYPSQNQNNRDGTWNTADAQPKDSGIWDSGRNQQQRQGRAWNPQDTQLKEDGGFDNQRGSGNFNPSDSQVRDNSGYDIRRNQRPSGQPWSPGDAQAKENGVWGSGGNGPQGSWQPGDTQLKDDATWSNGGDQNRQPWGENDSQVKDSGSWSGQGNQISNENWGSADAQRKDSWNADGRPPSESWKPEDSQIKDNDDANRQSGGTWGIRDEQTKVTPWDQGVTQQPPTPMWDSGRGWSPDNIGDTQVGGPVGIPDDAYVPTGENPDSGLSEVFPEQGQPPQGLPPQGLPPQSLPPQGSFDSIDRPDISTGIVDDRPRGDSGTSGGEYGPNDGNLIGDTGGVTSGFPANNGRVPQGNYKGGDTGRYPGDDPSQWRLEDSIPGTPGVDYPNFITIPTTGFDCKQHENPGYYGDVEARCQVFHICQADGRHDAFLCPVGTIFNQQYFVCVWWFNFNCDDTAMYYGLNADLYKGGHGAQGNFKGDAYNGGSTSGFIGDSFTTPSTVATGDIGIVGRPAYDGPVERQDIPRQDIKPVEDRDGVVIPDTGPLVDEGVRRMEQGVSRRPEGTVAPIPDLQTSIRTTTEQPARTSSPEVLSGVGPGTGVELPRRDSVGYRPEAEGKRNLNEGKRNWGANQLGIGGLGNNAGGNGKKWIPGQGKKQSDGAVYPGQNGGIKGGWGSSGSNEQSKKNRFWDGPDNQGQYNLAKRWGSDMNKPDGTQEKIWIAKAPVPPRKQEAIWLNRAYVTDEGEKLWKRQLPENEDALDSSTATLSRAPPGTKDWKLKNELPNVSNEPRISTGDQEISNDVRKRDDKDSIWVKSTDTVSNKEKRKMPLQNNNNKWWKETKIANILLNNSDKSVASDEPYVNPQERQYRNNEEASLDGLNVYFDLNKDYTSDKSAKQRIWTLL